MISFIWQLIALFLLTNFSSGWASVSREQINSLITLDEVLSGDFAPNPVRTSWHSDAGLQYRVGENVWIYNLELNETTHLVNGSGIIEHLTHDFDAISFSADKRFILIQHETKQVWRDSFLAKYDIYDQIENTFESLGPNPLRLQNHKNNQEFLQLFQWSPTGNGFVFVHDNDIYFRSSAALSPTSLQRVTFTGSATIHNGHADYIYEEEMFGSGVAVWFSPLSTKLAFITFNDTNVQSYRYPMYGEPGDLSKAYPDRMTIQYPKAGTTNPTFSLSLVDLQTDELEIQSFSFPNTAESEMHYIGAVGWVSDDELAVVTLNRVQNLAHWHLCLVSSLECRSFFKRQEANGWIDVYEFRAPLIISGHLFLTVAPTPQGHASYRHVLQFTSEGYAEALTSGNFSVFLILGRDTTNNCIYFSGTRLNPATNVSDPSQRHIYSVNPTTKELNCLTCELQNSYGEACLTNSATFSPNFLYFLHFCNGPNVPEVVIRDSMTLDVKRVWENNEEVRKQIGTKDLPKIKEYRVQVSGGFFAPVRLFLPNDYEEGSAKKYPLLIDVYGGPGSQKINQMYSIDWGTSLASSRGVIYGYIDGRGTGRQSTDYMFAAYRKLVRITVEDQLSVTKWLIQNLNAIDSNKVAIYGSSYGGHSAALMMGLDVDPVFQCGISVAPVTNYLYYDTMYTERFMGLPTPEDNEAGYDAIDVSRFVENFRNKSFFLIHGTADSNVHYQNSMLLARALEQKDIMFTQQTYPDEVHDIGLVKHLYHSIEKFLFSECFKE